MCLREVQGRGGGIFSINTKGSVPRSCSLGYRATLPSRYISFRGGGGAGPYVLLKDTNFVLRVSRSGFSKMVAGLKKPFQSAAILKTDQTCPGNEMGET